MYGIKLEPIELCTWEFLFFSFSTRILNLFINRHLENNCKSCGCFQMRTTTKSQAIAMNDTFLLEFFILFSYMFEMKIYIHIWNNLRGIQLLFLLLLKSIRLPLQNSADQTKQFQRVLLWLGTTTELSILFVNCFNFTIKYFHTMTREKKKACQLQL